MNPNNGLFTWYTLWSTHPEKTAVFFKDLFGWESFERKLGYMKSTTLKCGETMFGDLSKAQPGLGIPARWSAFVIVDDVNATAEKAKQHGGKIARAAFNQAGIGRLAVLNDPAGAEICIVAPEKPEEMGSVMGMNEGQINWNELMVNDPAKVLSFYKEVFGWDYKESDMGPMGTYYSIVKNGQSLGGIMKTPPHAENMPARWMTYLLAKDIAVKTAEAEKLGAKINSQFEIPGIGLAAFITEPGGSSLYLYEHRH